MQEEARYAAADAMNRQPQQLVHSIRLQASRSRWADPLTSALPRRPSCGVHDSARVGCRRPRAESGMRRHSTATMAQLFPPEYAMVLSSESESEMFDW